jgi:transcriptional regulator
MPATDRLHGTLDALVLTALLDGPLHGYAITRWIRERTADAVTIEEGSLYPALYRMERDELVRAEWGTSELGRKAKRYSITARGRRQLKAETTAFAAFVRAVSPILLRGASVHA